MARGGGQNQDQGEDPQAVVIGKQAVLPVQIQHIGEAAVYSADQRDRPDDRKHQEPEGIPIHHFFYRPVDGRSVSFFMCFMSFSLSICSACIVPWRHRIRHIFRGVQDRGLTWAV